MEWDQSHFLDRFQNEFSPLIYTYFIFADKIKTHYDSIMFGSGKDKGSKAETKRQLYQGKLQLLRLCTSNFLNEEDCLARFSHVPTASGVCSSFNAPSMESLLLPSGLDLVKLLKESGFHLRQQSDLKVIPEGHSTLNLMLDIHNIELGISDRTSEFIISIEAGKDVFDTVSRTMRLLPGHRYNFQMKPRIFFADPDIFRFQFRHRDCFLDEEVQRAKVEAIKERLQGHLGTLQAKAANGYAAARKILAA